MSLRITCLINQYPDFAHMLICREVLQIRELGMTLCPDGF